MLWRVIQTKVAKAKSDFMKQRINRNVYIWVRFWHQKKKLYILMRSMIGTAGYSG